MSDIVERLRTFNSWEKMFARYKLTQQAADEIERLRAALRECRKYVDDDDVYHGGKAVVDIVNEALGEPTPTAEPDAGS